MSISSQPQAFHMPSKRILSIDTFRGITFFLMIIVNEIHAVPGISPWLKHMPADANAMSLADIVFPAFLFIVGMSIPFSIQQRLSRGDDILHLNWHIATRALALIVMGLFMVNAESGFHQASMLISINSWAMLSYLAFFLIWGSIQRYRLAMRCAGLILLLVLALLYRGGSNGQNGMTVQWWGILGLIGWAYFIASLFLQLCRNKIYLILLSLVLCTTYYIFAHHFYDPRNPTLLGLVLSQAGHATHTLIVLAGILASRILFPNKEHGTEKKSSHRLIIATLYALLASSIGYVLQEPYGISKIYATPSWAMYSVALCIVSIGMLHYVIDLMDHQKWTRAFHAAAVNPLVLYLLPFMLEGIYRYLHIQSPVRYFYGTAGMIAALLYAIGLMYLLSKLNARDIKIQF